MKVISILLLASLLAACHTAPVECDTHLVAINPIPKAAAASDSKGDLAILSKNSGRPR